MSRAVEVAGALGGTALLGAGIAPFLHRQDVPDVWFRLQWPREVDEADALALVRHLASSRRPRVVTFEIRASRGSITYLAGVVQSDTERLRHLLTTYLPDALLDEVERPQLTLTRAAELRLGTRERSLRTTAATEVARALVGAVAGTTGCSIIQWQLGKRLAPSHVPKDSVGLPSTGRAIGQALRYGLAPLEAKERSELQSKVGDHGFATCLRIASTIADPKVAQGALRAVVGGLRVAEAPGAWFKVRRTDARSVMKATPPRRFAMAMNVGELTGLLGWPLGDGDYPGVTRIGSRRLPIPSAVPARGRVIGEGNHPTTRRPIALDARDGLMHTHVLGPTGVGKSTLLANLVVQDIQAGAGVVVIEPKGDLVADIVARIPKDRESDVVVLDPSDDEAPVGLNPLAAGSPELVTDQVLAVFRVLYADYLGPRTTDVLHAALLTLARSEHATLVGLPLLLTDDGLRRELTRPVRDDLALGPFWAWYDALSEPQRQQVIAPVMNKVRPFLLRARVRHVLGQSRPRFDIAKVFTEHKILLVPLSKGTLGSETASLIGSLLVAHLWQAVQARSRIDAERRRPVSLVIDEFQDFLHLPTDLADVLAQARGLGIGLTLAHQHLAQLSPTVRAAVLANARSRICFRLSAEDASVVARTTDQLDAQDFQRLGRYEIYTSLVANGETQHFCSASTNPLAAATGDGERIRKLSREHYGVARETIEADLHNLWNRADDTGKTPLGSRRRRSGEPESDGGTP